MNSLDMSYTLSLGEETFVVHMLIRFENSFDPDQDRQNIGPNLDPNGLTLISLQQIYS